MKKKILLGFLVTLAVVLVAGCDLGGRNIYYLLDGYVRAYTNADLKTVKDIFPKFYLDYKENSVNQESLNQELEYAKKTYGDDFNIKYEVKEEIKFTDEELKTFNEKVKNTYKSEDQATECYKYEGTITFNGSKRTDDSTLATIGRCKINGTWYLVRK